MKKIKVKIFDKNGIFLEQDTDIVTLKTQVGYRGIMHGATPLIANLVPSILYLGSKNNNQIRYEIQEGVVHSDKQEVQIFLSGIKVLDK
ncbi:putative ATP synthase epsilon chain [Mesomycoplasma conjunctivae]|uniref:PUTATIVE ATP synthase epsilon chain n=1 Tax=Mesomycoplasma conjunctivae (strain ATCC 25834 / NCTC 10147 / HRC/581) TaxID=572263 RepID=C5J776_MESCH|nr:ATP synthase epsilon chain [Mesomycoplasma conjunctivae]CAT05339.1 PUTATIVE ATP synthase epsilon chain [Mesomycoplasma conjunctivae]VEU66565.1 putative ATP synthase epsilon chain [Mesomycoplasma conjunctivae]